MSGFKKLCSVIFFLAFLLGVGALAADWFGFEPVAGVVEGCRSQDWFNIIMLVLLAISAIGVIVVLITALAARSKNSYQETENDLGSVCISKTALQRTVEDVIYNHPEVTSLKTSVRIVNRKKPYVDITAKVAPRGLISLATVAPILQKEIKDAIETLTGNEVRSVVVDVRENKNANDVMTTEEQERMQRAIDERGNFEPLDYGDDEATAELPTSSADAEEGGKSDAAASAEGESSSEAGTNDDAQAASDSARG